MDLLIADTLSPGDMWGCNLPLSSEFLQSTEATPESDDTCTLSLAGENSSCDSETLDLDLKAKTETLLYLPHGGLSM